MEPFNFIEYYKTISNTALLDILENPTNYQPHAVEAAKIEFDNRKLSIAEIDEAKAIILAKKEVHSKKTEKAKAIEDNLKNMGNVMVDTFNPIQKEEPNSNKSIWMISLFFAVSVIYQIVTNFGFIGLLLLEIDTLDFESILFFIPMFVLPIAIFKFWRRKSIGWILLTFYLTSWGLDAIWILYRIVAINLSPMPSFDFELLMPSPLSTIIQLSIMCGTLNILFKANIKDIYSIDKQKISITILLSLVFTVMMTAIYN